ncbi:glycerol-3-phosphate dehydrogenase [Pontibacter aydingkolensis]|uniref:Glycerol-3-phosphate dehydrogenase/oxidase n=1 Tax=Pontibacter aydingkolensis TaxID=1911536 RepID=A0ABS7CU69_9BACT|nr:glycerol-3-phosphate dehydrogenase/oxidase [Pontibacter aydingkolensis]MBW7467409.1 glycerol-3-phosphate dehydrogenase/oxidase [Pontibacter aydingkolensis]
MNRTHILHQLENHPDHWDVLIIGGGATGLGIAVDAATRGYKTLLLEQADFAKGTSSRSTKLIHGGVRYLALGQLKLVLNALKERWLLLHNAPHLVKTQPFVVPVYTWREAFLYFSGLKLYDLLAGKRSLGNSTFISKKKALKALPTIKATGLKGGIRYYDCQFDDSRLAINLAQTAVENGACVLNYMQVTGLQQNDAGKVCGVVAQDLETGLMYKPKAKVVINATGVFVDDILRLEQPDAKPLVRPSQGVHLVLSHIFLPGSEALMIPKTPDGRVLFAVPWQGKLLVGTTDTIRNTPELEPKALDREVDFILETAGGYLTRKPTAADVLSVFAGLRPLAAHKGNPKESKDIARNFKVILSGSNLITITGGKWTIYREMAESTLNKLIKASLLPHRPCITTNLPIHGHTLQQSTNPHLHAYGADATALEQLQLKHPELAKKLHPAYAYTKAEVVWAVRHEMARTVEDVLARRLRLLFLEAEAAIAAAPAVAAILADELQLPREWADEQIRQFTLLAKDYTLTPPVAVHQI